MKKLAIVTDSMSGLKPEDVINSDIFLINMPFLINGEEYFENEDLTEEKFFEMLDNNAEVFTSQPNFNVVTDLWNKLLQEYENIIHIPMSSGLSGTVDTAIRLSKDFDGRVKVIDNQRISVTLKQSVLDAEKMAKDGKTVDEICEYLEQSKLDASIYIMVSTLKYLKKGGRVTSAGAAIGTLLNIKPVLQIQGGKLDAYTKVMSSKLASIKMIQAIKKDLETRFAEFLNQGKMRLYVAYSKDKETALLFKQEVEKAIPELKVEFVDALSLGVSCHIGPNALALACSRSY